MYNAVGVLADGVKITITVNWGNIDERGNIDQKCK